MVETITPVVHGGSRRRWAGTLALHVLGASLSAAALGGALGGTGKLLGAPWGPAGVVLVVAVALLYMAREAFGIPVPVFDARRQVPQWWREAFRPGPTGFLYGLGLGVGFATHLRQGTLVAVAAAAAAGGDPAAGAMTVGAFGVARSAAVAVTWTARDRGGARTLGRRLERAATGAIPRVANGLALAAVGIAAAWAGPSTPPGGPAVVPVLILAGTFGWAAATKAIRPATWRAALAAHHLPRSANGAALVAVPVAEGVVTFLVLSGSIRAGAAVALVLLFLFSAALFRFRSRLGDGVPCGCFGTSRTRSVRLLLARNLALGIVAAAAAANPDGLRRLRAPTAEEWLPAALAVVGTILVAVMLRRSVAMSAGPDR